MKFFKNLWKYLVYFFKKDKYSWDSYVKMIRFFFTQIPFTVSYWSSVLGYGFGSSWSPNFLLFLSGANFTMFMIGLLNWWIIKNFQDCHSESYKKDNLLRFDICSCICILPCYLITRPLFFKKYKKVHKITN
ncbi:hypothetical protein [Mycoplasma ovis]|uniref:hypothetical protein n=1 Tax=Mycoplasma ovis TaxID=171632 RepID=UPI0011823F47|nr:hypothetical protein [Mycoplasma ovis]